MTTTKKEISEAQKQAKARYYQKNIKRIPFDIQKEEYEVIKSEAESLGLTVSGLIKEALESYLQKPIFLKGLKH